MEFSENEKLEKKNLLIDEQGLIFFIEAAKWTKFVSIVGIVLLGIALLATFIISFGKLASTPTPIIAVIPMILIVVIYAFPLYYLLQFSNFMKKASMNKDSISLTLAAKYLKMHYKYMGICIVVFIIIYLFLGLGLTIFR
jgi:hypothetical protein